LLAFNFLVVAAMDTFVASPFERWTLIWTPEEKQNKNIQKIVQIKRSLLNLSTTLFDVASGLGVEGRRFATPSTFCWPNIGHSHHPCPDGAVCVLLD
jgi:hypothetical protein